MKCALVSYWNDVDRLLPELATYDKVYAVEAAAYALLQRGVQVDKVIADFDTVPVASFAAFDVDIEILPARKNMTDTHALLQYIIEAYPLAEVVLYNAFTGRIEHALSLLSLFDEKQDLIIKTPATQMTRLDAGSYALEPKAGYRYLSLLALSPIRGLEIKHLQYELEPTDLTAFSDLTISNEFTPMKSGNISFLSGSLLVLYSKNES